MLKKIFMQIRISICGKSLARVGYGWENTSETQKGKDAVVPDFRGCLLLGCWRQWGLLGRC